MELLVGLDLGTTSIKAVAFDIYGSEHGSIFAPNPVTVQPDGSHSVDPDDLVYTAVGCLDKLITKLREHRVLAVGISTAMFSIFPIGRSGDPLLPSHTWVDTTVKTAQKIEPVDLYQLTGCRTHPVYPRVRIRWMIDNNPQLLYSADKWVSLSEYLFHALTGEWAVSQSTASTTGLLDIGKLDWSPEALEWCGISAEKLSPLVHAVFTLPAKTGPLPGIPIVIGAPDGLLCHFGTNSMKAGEMTSSIGTSAALRMLSPQPVLDPEKRTWCYYLAAGKWVYGGAINSGAIAYQWLRENILHEQPFSEPGPDPLIARALREVSPGCDGLSFLPTLSGERSPDWDPSLRGAVYGLSLTHGKLHLVRSVIEGITFRLYSIFELLRHMGQDVTMIRAAGGYTRTRDWMQLQADIFSIPIELPDVSEAAAFGAACLAGEAAGVRPMEETVSFVRVIDTFVPDPSLSEAYRNACRRSEKLYDLVRGGFSGF